ncbi:MAG: methionine--tRNA ligase, partial [Chthoniobacterales bacterium]
AGRLDEVLAVLVEASRLAAALAHPVIPVSSDRLLSQLGFPANLTTSWGVLGAGHQLGEPSPVFPRLDAENNA